MPCQVQFSCSYQGNDDCFLTMQMEIISIMVVLSAFEKLQVFGSLKIAVKVLVDLNNTK